MSVSLQVARILRVDHAGEKGAIRIYQAQIRVARLLWPACVPALEEMLVHEQKHFAIFENELRQRGIRHCHALALWGLGGMLLGVVTALLGPRAIWSCTAAVESTVYQHLQEQIDFLREHDPVALQAVLQIEADEKSHRDHALASGGSYAGMNRPVWWLVSAATTLAISLSERF